MALISCDCDYGGARYGIFSVWHFYGMAFKYHTDKYHTVQVRYGILKVRCGILSKIILKNTIPYKYSMAFLKYGMVLSKNGLEKYHTVQVQYGIIKVRYGIFRNHLEKYHTVQVQYGIF